jgi:hypothetical protein
VISTSDEFAATNSFPRFVSSSCNDKPS